MQPLLSEDGAGRAVAFDADGTLWRGDVGEDFLRLLATEQRYPAMKGRRGIYEEYERRVAVDPASGYAFAVEVMEGALEADVHEDARTFFGRRFSGRIFRSMRELLTGLKARGYDVWIVS
ncbi:MAG: haloacid dehalogenase-like hydrolase, partial [Myxococcaceae bacterium]